MTASDQGGINPKPSHSSIRQTDINILDSGKGVLLEQVQPGPYNLNYTCFLIPRIPSQQLIGDLADNLPQWLKMICTSFNWKLEFVTVCPDYFQWALSVLPVVPTGNIIQQVRNGTSELILANFSRFKNESMADDFWATGYLILSGIQPNPKEIVERYIRMVRQQH